MSDDYGVVVSAPSNNFDTTATTTTYNGYSTGGNSSSPKGNSFYDDYLSNRDFTTKQLNREDSDIIASFNTFVNEELKEANDFIMAQYENATSFIDFDDITDSLVKFYYESSDSPYLGIGEYLALSRFKPISKLKKPLSFIYDTFIKKSKDENYIQYIIKKAGKDYFMREIAEFFADIVDVINPLLDMERNDKNEIVAIRSDGFTMEKDGEELIATVLINSVGLIPFGKSVQKVEDDILKNDDSAPTTTPNDTSNDENIVLDKRDPGTTTISVPNNEFILKTPPAKALTPKNKLDLSDYGKATNKAILKRKADEDTAVNAYNSTIAEYKSTESIYLHKLKKDKVKKNPYHTKYLPILKRLEELGKKQFITANKTIKLNNNQKKKKNIDVSKLLNELVKTCLSANEIYQIVTDTFGDVLTTDAKDIIQEHLDRNKKYTNCCLLLKCKPCEYTDKKYYDDESGKGN